MRGVDPRLADLARLTEDSNRNDQGLKFDSTNVINNYLNAVPQSAAAMPENRGPVVNVKARDNEAAGSVSLNNIAQQPPGFDAYALAMPDVSFYAPREIYRNQRVIDNARAQRAMTRGSDTLHQRMVDQQWK